MAISLQKGGNVNLSREAPSMAKMVIGLGWNTRATDGSAFDPVSYTHLDVYKRQLDVLDQTRGHPAAAQDAWQRFEECMPTILAAKAPALDVQQDGQVAIDDIANGRGPVSYTHLDVYKRQL